MCIRCCSDFSATFVNCATAMKSCVVVLILSASLASASELHEAKFDVFALEKGIIVHEKVDVNPQDKTISIKMPAHNNLDKMKLIADYKNRYTMRYLPDYNVCYLSELDQSQFPDPNTLAMVTEIERKGHVLSELWVNVPNVTYSYNIKPEPLTNRSFLCDKMKELCDGVPIQVIEEIDEDPQQIEVLKNGLQLLPRTDSDEETRKKRQIFCPPEQEKSACLVKNQFCHYITNCKLKWNPQKQSDEEDCGRDHLFGKARCCMPCCKDPAAATDELKSCDKLVLSEVVKFCQLIK